MDTGCRGLALVTLGGAELAAKWPAGRLPLVSEETSVQVDGVGVSWAVGAWELSVNHSLVGTGQAGGTVGATFLLSHTSVGNSRPQGPLLCFLNTSI